jgi:hypothetical protein
MLAGTNSHNRRFPRVSQVSYPDNFAWSQWDAGGPPHGKSGERSPTPTARALTAPECRLRWALATEHAPVAEPSRRTERAELMSRDNVHQASLDVTHDRLPRRSIAASPRSSTTSSHFLCARESPPVPHLTVTVDPRELARSHTIQQPRGEGTRGDPTGELREERR